MGNRARFVIVLMLFVLTFTLLAFPAVVPAGAPAGVTALDGFHPPEGTNGDIVCQAVQSDGKILVGGHFSSLGGGSQAYLGRLNADGSLDSSFTLTLDSSVPAMATVEAIRPR